MKNNLNKNINNVQYHQLYMVKIIFSIISKHIKIILYKNYMEKVKLLVILKSISVSVIIVKHSQHKLKIAPMH
jgi:hypothetical protein